jgi:hypothetical protein
MDWREAHAEDVAECLEIEPGLSGDETVGRRLALETWKRLTRSLACNSAVVEMRGKKVAFGLSVFVTPQFMDGELRSPRPGVNARILASVAEGKPAVRAESDLCAAKDAMDVVIMSCNYRYAAMNAEETRRAEMALPTAFAEAHVGYRLNRILVETLTERQRQVHESAGVWRRVMEDAASGRTWLLLTRDDAVAVSGSVAGPMFDYHEPVLGLRRAEQQLLAEALMSGTDKELAARLNLSVPTVKKRWASLFDQVAEMRPELLPEDERKESVESRGPQKRHRILAYVRAHPEEVRPYRWRMTVA